MIADPKSLIVRNTQLLKIVSWSFYIPVVFAFSVKRILFLPYLRIDYQNLFCNLLETNFNLEAASFRSCESSVSLFPCIHEKQSC